MKKLFGELTIVIPHHDYIKGLGELLVDLAEIRNIVIIKGGSFAQNCNKGFKAVNTECVCFLNDDTRIFDISAFRSMMEMLSEYSIVGCNVEPKYNGFCITDGRIIDAKANNLKAEYPSGCCILMRADTFFEIGGFCEEFINGKEDVDFYLRAKKMGHKIGISSCIIFHEESASTGRFTHHDTNLDLFNKKWEGLYRG